MTGSLKNQTIKMANLKLNQIVPLIKKTSPYIGATAFLVILLLTTNNTGPNISTDSVLYIGAAERFLSTGHLEVPLTSWDSEKHYAPLSHFPPLLPVVLASISWLFNIDPVSAGRLLNAVCIFALSLMLLLPMANSFLKLFLMLAFLTGQALIYVHLWVWSEPLFLLLIVASLWVSSKVITQAADTRYIILLAFLSSLATLTRYAGIYLFIGYGGLLLLQSNVFKTKIRQLAGYISIYCITVIPWFLWLSAQGSSARTISFYADGLWATLVHDMLPTIVHWLVPYWLPSILKMALVSIGIASLTIAILGRIKNFQNERINPLVYISFFLFTTYLIFIFSARLFVDSAIPFNDRILLPALIHLALGLSYLVEHLIKSKTYVTVSLMILGLMIFNNILTNAPRFHHTAVYGQGFTAEVWQNSETIAWLRELPPDVIIYSNGADAISALLPSTAKYTPTIHEQHHISAFAEQVKLSEPAVLVLFNDIHTHWLMGREMLSDLEGPLSIEFPKSVVIGWGLESMMSLSD